jgi:hypothetical protein
MVFRNNPKVFYFLENKDQERKWKPNYPEVSGLMGAAPCRADSRNRETKKAQAIRFQLFTVKIAIVNNFC